MCYQSSEDRVHSKRAHPYEQLEGYLRRQRPDERGFVAGCDVRECHSPSAFLYYSIGCASLLSLHMNFGISLSISVNRPARGIIRIAFTLYVKLGGTDVLIMLSLQIRTHGISLHFSHLL